MIDVEVRRAEPCDLDAARHVIVETWLKTYVPIHGHLKVQDIIERWHNPSNISAQIGSPDQLFGVGVLAGRICGHVLAFMDGEALKIARLYVLGDVHGRGVGSALFKFALDSYPKAQSMVLEVDQQNQNAIKFYESKGMEVTGQTECCGNDSDISALVMTRNLNG